MAKFLDFGGEAALLGAAWIYSMPALYFLKVAKGGLEALTGIRTADMLAAVGDMALLKGKDLGFRGLKKVWNFMDKKWNIGSHAPEIDRWFDQDRAKLKAPKRFLLRRIGNVGVKARLKHLVSAFVPLPTGFTPFSKELAAKITKKAASNTKDPMWKKAGKGLARGAAVVMGAERLGEDKNHSAEAVKIDSMYKALLTAK